MPFRNTLNQLARSVDSHFQTYRSKDGQKIAGQTQFQANSARKIAPEGTPFAEGLCPSGILITNWQAVLTAIFILIGQ